LRRKRRYSTQTIKTKNSVSNFPNYSKAKNNSSIWKKIFTWFFIIIVLAAASYFVYNINWQQDTINSTLFDTLSVGEQEIKPKQISEPIQPAPFKKTVQIEILNGCGVNGLTKIFEEFLRQEKFDVVNTDNYKENGKTNWGVRESRVIDNIGAPEQAERVAESLGIPFTNIVSREDPAAIYDVSVVLGRDFKNLKGFKDFSK